MSNLKKLKKAVIATSLLFIVLGCSQSSRSRAANEEKPVSGLNSETSIAQAQEDPGMFDVSIPKGKYECRDAATNRKTKHSFYLASDGSYQRINGQRGKYTYMPSQETPETYMYVTWVSGPNKIWDRSAYINLQDSPRIDLGVSNSNPRPPYEEVCRLK